MFGLDAQVSNSAVDFDVTEQQLDGAEIAGLSVDFRCLRPAQRIRAVPTRPSCLIPRFGGVILSLEWKGTLWDKFVTRAPRTIARRAICLANLSRGASSSPSSRTVATQCTPDPCGST